MLWQQESVQCMVHYSFFLLYLSIYVHLIHLKGEIPNKSQSSAEVKMCKGYQGQIDNAKGLKRMRNSLIARNRLVNTVLTRNWTRDFALKCRCMTPMVTVTSAHHSDRSTVDAYTLTVIHEQICRLLENNKKTRKFKQGRAPKN